MTVCFVHEDASSVGCNRKSPTSNRLEAESSSDDEEKQMSDWTASTDGTDDFDTEWYSGNSEFLHFFHCVIV